MLALLSIPGAIAYIVVELLPDVFRSRTAQRTARGLKKAMDRRRTCVGTRTRRG